MAQSNRCKNCGGTLLIQPYSKQAECDSCGQVFELDDNRVQFANLYSQADDAWGRKDFDEAIRFYKQIVAEDNTQSEAHWGIALCRYGIGYELDPISYKQMPTCNRINRTSIFDDKDYLAAIKYAGESARAGYMQRATEIDRISKDFLKIVDQEKPYDVFISYKRTDANGLRTRDSEYAKKLYMFLTEKGVRVFFAEVSLRAVAGEKYEPYIFAALNSARVMVLFGSSREYIEATWVKNEWRRFLILSQNDPNKSLIPAYIGGDPYKVFPQELLGIQSYDVGSPVFVDEIYETVKKKLSAKEKVQGGQTLQAKYASKETVMKLVNELDCDPESAVEALVLMQGDIGKTKDYLRSEPEYKKNYWKCVGCGANNTHDVCHNPNCNTTKVESLDIEAKRKAYEAKKKSQAALKKSQSKVRGAIKNFVTNHKKLTIAIVVLVIFLIFRGSIGALLYSCSGNEIPTFDEGEYTPSGNIENVGKDKDLYTPQLIRAFGGTYKASGKEREAIIEFTSCSESGELSGTFSFYADGKFGQYSVKGQIVDKAKNGNCEIELEPVAWINQPSSYTMLDKMTLEVTQSYSQITSSSYSLSLSTAEADKYNIKTAEDLKNLNNSSKAYFFGLI
ncbi:MAG: TIR domain-containing protein [Ruminococcaceae bacterium]|nr:TIR domain-containing protein [Oscillospiraceae bacterium]